MSLISNGISSVQAYSLSGGIWPDGRSVEMPQVALVKWCSVLKGVLYQVYVNGNYAGTTVYFGQKQMIVSVPSSFTSAVRIEVFAVLPEHADIDFSSELVGSFNGSRVKLIMSCSQNLPEGATMEIYYDNGTGQIDYENPISDTAIEVWPNWQDKGGMGMSRFGLSDFGYDSSSPIGFGVGCFGKNPLGIDADTIEWVSPILPAGLYKFAVIVVDKKGNKSNPVESEPVTVIPEPKPADGLEILSYDKQANELILKIT
jgi:hypothetical protein